MTNTALSSKEELRQKYFELTKKHAKGNLSVKTITSMIEEAEEKNRADEKTRKVREEKARIDAEMREAIKVKRGSWEEFTSTKTFMKNCENENEGCFAHLCYWANGIIQSHEEKTKKFSENLLKSPCYALEWSSSYFDHAARYEVAFEIRSAFNKGVFANEMSIFLQREVFRLAGNGSYSTSQQTNLVSRCKLEAYVYASSFMNQIC